MIFIDIDGVLIDFYGTAKKFGIEIKLNKFGLWNWGEQNGRYINAAGEYCFCSYPAPEDFYRIAELQPWFLRVISRMELASENYTFITKDYARLKKDCIVENSRLQDYFYSPYEKCRCIEAPVKSEHCRCVVDLLIDDNAAECKAWREKGGLAHHFNLTSNDPYGDFLKFWRK